VQGPRVVRGGALPPALLCAAAGLALAFAPRRVWLPSLLTLSVTTILLAALPIPREWLEGVFLGCWASLAATAVTVHLPRGMTASGALGLSFNAGLWSGAEVALAGSRLDIAEALACVWLLFPAAFIVAWRAPIIIKIVASWFVAVAILAATLQFLPVTPGYLPDHLD
jgi:hypothetical protein